MDTQAKENRLAILLSRIRIPLTLAGGVTLVAGAVTSIDWLGLTGLVLFVVGMILYFRFGRVRIPAIPVVPPVRGTWTAVNSPATKVPSHGLHAYGQTYAIDLIPNDDGESNLELTWKGGIRSPENFEGFGEKVYSPVAGSVISVRNHSRDHLSRDSWPALIYFFAEGAVRELTGPGRLLGNHVTIETDAGTYAVLAHLKRDSILVEPGDRVDAGQEIAACGNSGSSTQPHLHFQLMDKRSPLIAAGLPFEFRANGGPTIPIPQSGEVLNLPG